MARLIQLLRGLKADLPILHEGEVGLVQDTKEVFIGNDTGNIQIATKEQLPTKMSQLENDIGAGRGVKIKIDTTEPNDLLPGDFWYMEL